MRYDLVICGGAGQGVVTLARVFTLGALKEGFEAHSVAWFGIAKTEGPVLAHVRIGTPAGKSPKIRLGRADALVALDALEGLKQAKYLKPGGMVIMDETGMPPVYSSLHPGAYPDKSKVESALKPAEIRWVPTQALAQKAGTPKLGGAVMLGAIAAASHKVDRDQLVIALREEQPEMADAEAEAFYLGYGYITGKEI